MLKKDFFNQKTLKAARELLGSFLVRRIGKQTIRTMIVETEAYNGPHDKASHASRGMTERNKVMFSEPGTIYVYFTYGMHNMFNIVTEKKDYPAAVLIRAVDPMGAQLNTAGPARLTKALGIDRKFNSRSIMTKKYGLWIEREDRPVGIVSAKRVGIDYAEEYRDKKWRYYISDNPFVSKR